jgi:hypothetical protein
MQLILLFKLVLIVAMVAGGVGWVMNVAALMKCDFDPIGKCEVIRVVGVFVSPVGAVLGFMEIGE